VAKSVFVYIRPAINAKTKWKFVFWSAVKQIRSITELNVLKDAVSMDWTVNLVIILSVLANPVRLRRRYRNNNNVSDKSQSTESANQASTTGIKAAKALMLEACTARIADIHAIIPDATERAVRTLNMCHELLRRLTLHAKKIWMGTLALEENIGVVGYGQGVVPKNAVSPK